MKRTQFNNITMIMALSLFIFACQDKKESLPAGGQKPPLAFTECTDPRPEACTKELRPVCASRDTGVRCVTTPCPSTEKVTYSNACTACADLKVHGYTIGACKMTPAK